ncbi:Palmitoyltransferase [Caenorhabditis elegans]|uniref:Palmitoyltransferase n=2 Tax=Caenorhabditis elegans TaxID=6239 RepID=H2KYE9_CAEEL|nr:Palmitoyltransferase [Caenorhabditis elegans]CCD62806.1 Palmitoyltransferase [Caenorhabditis elegans]|eukprot:NP_001024514.2 Palmitoyltransferase [Caenorhabditis elegans]
MNGDTEVLTHNLLKPAVVVDSFNLHAVISATQHGHVESVEAALKQGLSPNTTDDDGCSLLHWAAINNRLEVARLLISYNADANLIGGVLASSPIHWAARNGLVAMCAVLVKGGAVCNVRDIQGYTPIHLAIQGNHVPLVAYFLLKFEYAKDISDNSGMTPAMMCAKRSFTMFPLRLIVRAGADLSLKEHFSGNTALHLAAQDRNSSAVMELLEGNANVNIRNKQSETPLDMARTIKSPQILDLMEDAARRQGVSRTSCFRRSFVPPISTYFFFLVPMFGFFMTYLLFKYLPLIIATFSTLISCIFLMVLIRFDYHDPTYKLLPYGVTIAEAILMVLSWSAYAHWYVPWWAQMLFVLSVLALAFTLFRIGTLDPGVVRAAKNCHQLFVNEAEAGIQHQQKYCFTCFIRKMDHTKHCAVCGFCVNNFDHHCPWLNSCVTRRNMREFIMFVISVSVSSAIYCMATSHYALLQIEDHGLEEFLETDAFLMITIILSAMHALMLAVLFCVQMNQISQGVTTNDRIKARRAGHAHSHSGSTDYNVIHHKPSISKRCHNLLEFFSSNGDPNW